MSNLNDYYHNDDPRNRQPEVPALERCYTCEFLFEESLMIEYAGELFCSERCLETHAIEMKG